VIYINKENRTYDQIVGNIQGANGDPSLARFGNTITPNQHTLAMRFGLPDNFYADAEVSPTGHDWIDGAYASEYVQKMWGIGYSYGLQPLADEHGEQCLTRAAKGRRRKDGQ